MKRIIAIILALSLNIIAVPFVQAAEDTGLNILDRYIEIEAEDGILSEDTLITVNEDSSASGGKYIMIGETAVTGDTITATYDAGTLKRKAFYYEIFFRVKRGIKSSAAFKYSVDNGKTYSSCWGTSKTVWEWEHAGTVTVDKGKFTLKLTNHSESRSACIDKIVITTSKTFVPEGMGECPAELFEEGYTAEFSDEISKQYPLRKEHPRLFVSPEEIDELRTRLENATDDRKEYYNDMRKEGVTYRSFKLNSSFTDENSNDSYLRYIELNAFNYLLYGESLSASNAIRGITEYLNTLEYVNNGSSTGQPIMLDAVNTAARVYDWCYYAMTEKQKKDIILLCVHHLSNHEVRWPAGGQIAYANGHTVEENPMSTSFAFSIAVYDEYPDAYNQVAERIYNEYIPYLNYLYDDAMPNQGYNYGVFLRLKCELKLKWILNSIGYGDLISEKQHALAYQMIYSRLPDGSFLNDGDDGIAGGSYYGSSYTAMLASNLYDDPYLRQEYQRGNYVRFSIAMKAYKVDHMILDKPETGMKNFTDLPLSSWSGMQNGMMIAKTGWDEGYNSNDMTVSMKVPQKFTKGHRHLDSGEFEIYYKGLLAMDSGSYFAYSSAHNRGYAMQTIAHNCMLIYDPESNASTTSFLEGYPSMGGQWPPNYKLASNLEEVKDPANDYGKVLGYDWGEDMNKPEYTYLKGDLTLAYTTANSKLKKYTRTFMFNNFFDDVYPGCLIVLDRIKTENGEGSPVENTWLIHSEKEPEITGNTVKIEADGSKYNGRLINTTLLPEKDNLTIEAIGGSGKEFLVGTKNYEASTVNPESGKWRAEISQTVPSEDETFLNVIQVSDKGTTPLEVEKLSAEGYAGAKIKDRIIFLSESDIKNDGPVKISAKSVDTALWQIDGLSAGTWNIIDENGKLVATKNTSDTSGVICFKAAGGSYSLEKAGSGYASKDFSFDANRVESESEPYVSIGNVMADMELKVKNGKVFAEADKLARELGMTKSITAEGKVRFHKIGYNMDFEAGSRYVTSYASGRVGTFYIDDGAPFYEEDKFYVPITAVPKIAYYSVSYYPNQNLVMMKSSSSANMEDCLIPVAEKPVTVNMLDKYYYNLGENRAVFFAKIEEAVEKNVKEAGICIVRNGKTLRFRNTGELRADGTFGIMLTSFGRVGSSSNLKGYVIYEEDGEDVTLYEAPAVFPDASIPDSGCVYAGSKNGNESVWNVKVVPGSSNSVDLTWRRNKEMYIGTSQRPFMRFKLPSIPEGVNVKEVTLTMYVKGSTPINGIAACVVPNDWDSSIYETAGYKKEFPGPRLAEDVLAASITTETGALAGNGSWEKVVLKLDPEALRECKDGMLSVTLIMDYVDTNPTYKVNATDDSMIPYLSFKL